MHRFRDKEPLERVKPKAVAHYREYKTDLQEDFHSRCGYCNSMDFWTGGIRFSQLDHFIPKKYLVHISEHEYGNLVYSCFYCNNSKRAKWPSKDENIAILNDEGFVHPREKDYLNHLQRDRNGNIVAFSVLGHYMIKALKLNLKRHAIVWQLERLELIFDSIESEFKQATGKIPHELGDKISMLFFEYRGYLKELQKENNC